MLNYIRNMDPRLKRFLKGLVSALLGIIITTVFSYTVTFLQTNPALFAGTAGLIASVLLALEKSIPNNL